MSEHSNALSRRTFLASGLAAVAGAGILSANPMEAFAVTSAEKQAEAAATLDRLQAVEVKLDQASNDYFTALSEQEAAQEKMDEAQAKIDEASDQIADLQDKLGTRARGMYRSGSFSFLDVLLSATTFQAFTTNWDTLNQMNENDSKMVEETKALKSEVEAQKAEYAAQEAVAAEQAEQAAAVKAEADQLVRELQATYDSLTAEAARLLAEEEEARRREEEARARAEEEARRRQEQSVGGGSSSVDNSKAQTVTGNVVVDRAYSQYGKPYVWAAVGPNSFDCSGFVSYCLTGSFSRLGTTYTFLTYTAVTDPQPGDICVNAQHCGVYVGNGMMVHASVSRGVVEAPVWSSMVYRRY